ncbi:MAG: thioredoxin domain-containing protein [Candidatus Pacebacteria bacterium]|nr:thioredoxin domain-containing protein [Candidatus Paceibacterota bacterium]
MENNQKEKREEEKVGDVTFVTVEENSSASLSASTGKDRVLPISILVAAVMIAGALVFATIYKGGGTGAGAAALQNGGAGTAQAPAASTTAIFALGSRDAILGNADAPVTVIEYGDYQCPYCAQYFSTIEPIIVKNYVNTGKVKMVFRDFPFLGPESTASAGAAQCAEDQNKLWAYHDALYNAKLASDAKGGTENDGSLNRALFMSIATKVGLNTSTFADCIDNNKDAGIVAQEKVDASAGGVNSTPATVVNGVLVVDANGDSVGSNSTAVLNAIAAAAGGAK